MTKIKVKIKKKPTRNPLVAPSRTRSGAGRHTDRRKQVKHKHMEE